MKGLFSCVLALMFACTTLQARECCEPCDFSEFQLNSDAIYREGVGAHEGAATCLGASMLAWGIGLTVVIAIIAGVVHQSKATTTNATTN
jgi:hypothetical protein